MNQSTPKIKINLAPVIQELCFMYSQVANNRVRLVARYAKMKAPATKINGKSTYNITQEQYQIIYEELGLPDGYTYQDLPFIIPKEAA